MDLDELVVEKELVVIFMGTPDFSVPVLNALMELYKVRAVVTQPDKPVGRKGELKPSPVKKFANDHTILVLQPEKIKNSVQEILDLMPDLIVTCAYGQILPKEIRNLLTGLLCMRIPFMQLFLSIIRLRKAESFL